MIIQEETKESDCQWDYLPYEMWQYIFGFVEEATDVLSSSLVSKDWNEMVTFVTKQR